MLSALWVVVQGLFCLWLIFGVVTWIIYGVIRIASAIGEATRTQAPKGAEPLPVKTVLMNKAKSIYHSRYFILYVLWFGMWGILIVAWIVGKLY